MPPSKKRARVDASSSSNDRITLGEEHSGHPGVVKLWRSGTLCDAEVEVGGSTFPAHRIILAGGSPYFEARFTQPGFSDNDGPLKLSGMAANVFTGVLDFLYTGKCELGSTDLLVPTLEAATLLQVQTLIHAVSDAIATRLTPESSIGAWELADRYALPELESAAKQCALKCFEDVKDDALAAMTPSMLRELLCADELVVSSEETVFSRLSKWHAAQSPPPAEASLVGLLELVRFPLMAPVFVNQTVMTAPMMGTLATAQTLTKSLLNHISAPAKRRAGVLRWQFVPREAAPYSLIPWIHLPGVASTSNVTMQYRNHNFVGEFKSLESRDMHVERREAGWWAGPRNGLCAVACVDLYEIRCLVDDECVANVLCKDIPISSDTPVA